MPTRTTTVLGFTVGTTALRLARIATLIGGSLVFLHACEVSRSAFLGDVLVEVTIGAALGVSGLAIAWFEVRGTDYSDTDNAYVERRYDSVQDFEPVHGDRQVIVSRTENREFLVESDGLSVRARVARSGELVFHGHDLSGMHPEYEWGWAFRPDTFPAIRAALGGGRTDLLDLLEAAIHRWDLEHRLDPGSWLHNQGIPAAFRERGDTSSRPTRELPVIRPHHSVRPSPTHTVPPPTNSPAVPAPVPPTRPGRPAPRGTEYRNEPRAHRHRRSADTRDYEFDDGEQRRWSQPGRGYRQ